MSALGRSSRQRRQAMLLVLVVLLAAVLAVAAGAWLQEAAKGEWEREQSLVAEVDGRVAALEASATREDGADPAVQPVPEAPDKGGVLGELAASMEEAGVLFVDLTELDELDELPGAAEAASSTSVLRSHRFELTVDGPLTHVVTLLDALQAAPRLLRTDRFALEAIRPSGIEAYPASALARYAISPDEQLYRMTLRLSAFSQR
ncbi:hypothetical protein IDH44_23755 [Paenibacillus sp. IB182496]|uniref:Uncharacterized protein n=1 Tax=Paenibacillus sabuli TaxID=2772509 RepID=A0A927GUC8_9BACL|nr:hypothetical protein [Paenibacillus sabuli]MBD2848221.1 hypothetical protein [Paenibacillus sabuli]